MSGKIELTENKSRQIKVDIFGKTYTLKGDSESGYVEKIADYVDQKMKALSTNSEIVDSSKIAILAALNIADELFKTKDELIGKLKLNEEKAADLLNLLNNEFKKCEDFIE